MKEQVAEQYYMVVNEQSTGPYTYEELIIHPNLTPETLVWKPGIDNWVAASTFPELATVFSKAEEKPYQEQTHDQQAPPNYNNFANNPQYQDGHIYNDPRNGNPYTNQENSHFGHQNHPYGNQGGHQSYGGYHRPHHEGYYEQERRYQNDYRPGIRTNWLPWAIVATVVGFFTSCIGAIFGIIGIVQSSKANNLYARGYDVEGDAANSNAKTMTIIGLILAGIGVLVLFWAGSLFGNLGNLSYL